MSPPKNDDVIYEQPLRLKQLINHIDRSNERNGITDRFNGAV